MEIIRPDGTKVIVPGCCNLGLDGSSTHCLNRWVGCTSVKFSDCIWRKDTGRGSGMVDETPGLRMDGGVPRTR